VLPGLLPACVLLATAWAQSSEGGEKFTCPKNTGEFADPDNCRKFYQCVNDFPYANSCPSGLYWHDIKKQCVYKREVVCGPVPTTEAPITTADPYAATPCDTRNCILAEGCFCSKDGTRHPLADDPNLELTEIPQMVLLALDGAVNGQNYNHYITLFNDTVYKNPNECPMRGTFFVSHEYSSYQMVADLYQKGHEIAINSITSRQLSAESYDEWVQEMVGMRSMLSKWANISTADMNGLRAPRLKPGGKSQYDMMYEYGFLWDSSVTVPPLNTPLWPYSLDYEIPHKCRSDGCPTSQYPGLWEFPLNTHYVKDYEGGHCPYLDQCVLFNFEPVDILAWFQEDFNRHYTTNRAPYMLSFHTNWFNEANLIEGLNMFLQWVNKKDDVYFVTMTQALNWMQNPKTIRELSSLNEWNCRDRLQRPVACNLPNTCVVDFKPPTDVEPSWVPGTRYFTTCESCPKTYPWLYDFEGDQGEPDYYVPPEIVKRK